MTAWTYEGAHDTSRYWIGRHGHYVIWVADASDGLNGFRSVDDGRLTYEEPNPLETVWQQTPLPVEWWPLWLRELDDCAVDIGL